MAPIETRVAEGKIGEEIIRVAEEEGYNTIVIGRRGLSPVKGVLLGSVTRQVLSLARKMTVFVVGHEVAFNPDCPISPLLLPVDGSEPSLAAVRQGTTLAQSFRGRQPAAYPAARYRFCHTDRLSEGNSAFSTRKEKNPGGQPPDFCEEAGLTGNGRR